MKQTNRMRLICIIIFSLAFSTGAIAQNKTSFVNPMIGSGGHGHVFVGASVPFGAVQVGPQNIFKGWDWCSGYHYSDNWLIGFSHTHLSGTGGNDLGDILLMPYTGSIKIKAGTQKDPLSGFGSHYSHADEIVQPGYYSIKLKDFPVKVELTASERVGFHQYSFNSSQEAHIVVDLKDGNGDEATDSYITLKDKYTLTGYRFSTGWAKDQRLFFAIRSSEPFTHVNLYDNDHPRVGNRGRGKGIKALLSFDKAPKLLKLKVGISPVSEENALANIDAEIPGWDFNSVRKVADQKWNRELSKIDIETADKNQRTIFYTALYHTMIDPALFNDHNHDYRGTDQKVYKKAAFNDYTIFSLWDTYRALQPLYTLIQPERDKDIISSMLAIYQQQQRLPIWHLNGNETEVMPGVSGVQVVAEAYLKGIDGFNPALAYEAVKKSTMRDELGLTYAKNLTYIPSDKIVESVAKAMEYSISDGSIALMAKKMGHTADADYYLKRSHNYRLYFDPATRFFRGRMTNGKWDPVFQPGRISHPWINDYTEGNAWQYLWLVPQDVEGLINLLGGDKAFSMKLDSLFKITVAPDPNAPPDIAGLIGEYAHGNEPGHHIPYLYAYAGQQWKTAEKTDFIMSHFYLNKPDGISGNEDCGQMSAWYVFSAMGFYPVFPANGAYVLGRPLFNKASIKLAHNKTFIVLTENNTPDNKYIQSAAWNGKKYSKSYIRQEDIQAGGVLKLVMGKNPNLAFGSLPNDRPKSRY